MGLRLALLCQAPMRANRIASFPAGEPLDGPGLERAQTVSFGFDDRARCLRSLTLAARQTAEALRLPAEIEPDLRECDDGRWAGLSLDAVQADDPVGLAQWLRDPASRPHGGEPLLDLLARVAAWLDNQRDRSEHMVAITPASVVRAAIVAALGAAPAAFWRIDIAPLSVTKLNRNGEGWTLASANQRLHGARDH